MNTCPYCGIATQPGDHFCLNCGNRLRASRSPIQGHCLYCGVATQPGDHFCLNCGNRLHPATPSASQDEAIIVIAKAERIEPSARLIVYGESGEVLQEYLIEKSKVSIGRAATSDIMFMKDKLTSLHHATLSYENGRYVLRDEHSANGTFVNGEQIEAATPYVLQDGNHIGIGNHKLIFRLSQ